LHVVSTMIRFKNAGNIIEYKELDGLERTSLSHNYAKSEIWILLFYFEQNLLFNLLHLHLLHLLLEY